MSGLDRQHGFARVDMESRPAAWVECLDTVHRHPFYRAYKERVRTLLAPRPGGLYLEVGSGVGADAMALGETAIGVDRSMTMCREARVRGLRHSVVGDAERLPLLSERVEGCWADRTFQHLADPAGALREMVRVMRAGATIVVVDPDYGTQRMNFPDQDLAAKVMKFRADHLLRNGTLAHRMSDMFVASSLEEVSVEERILVVRDPTALDNVLGLRSWARTALDRGLMTASEVAQWESLYDLTIAEGRFRWSVSFFITAGRKLHATPA